jgi:signal transduction histidine kinase
MVESNVEMLDGMHILENTLTPMLDAQKNVNGVLVVSHDVTEQRKAEAELIESQKMVGIGTLAAGIAHEINSPLQVITGYSDSLLKELQVAARLEGERPERQLKTINRNAWRVAEIVRSLQHYAYPNTDRASQTELNELVKDTLILIEHQLKSWSNIAVETRLAADLPPFMCDPNKIIQVLINLLSNARDAMPMGGTIKIETAYQADPERLVLTIADDGDGIPEAVRKRIFDPFFTTKIVGKGTGLGLSIVQGIVRAHGGEIQVESVLKAGTTFTISLPLIMPVQESGGDAENLTEEAARARYD